MGDTKRTGDGLKPSEVREPLRQALEGESSRRFEEREPGEREFLEPGRLEYERDLDRKILDRLEVRYARWIEPKRLAEAREKLIHYESDPEFEEGLGRRVPDLDASEKAAFKGYYDGRSLHVRRDIEGLSTNVHERLHSLADPKAAEILGEHVVEGMTQELADREQDLTIRLWRYERRPNGGLEAIPPPEYYEAEKITYRKLCDLAGESALMEAYFQGDGRRLQQSVDAQLGDGAWTAIRSLLEQYSRSGDPEALARAHRLLSSRRRDSW